MNTIGKAAGLGVTTFLFSLAGLWIQSLAPATLMGDAKGAIGAVVGLVTLLLALVLGLLISVAYSVLAAQLNSAQDQDVAIHQLDFVLVRYGPEADGVRRWLKDQVLSAKARFFGRSDAVVTFTHAQSREGASGLDALLAELKPADEDQRNLLATAKTLGHQFLRTQLSMSRQLKNPVPSLLIVVVLGWSSLLFLGYGLLATFNPIALAAQALGALSVASAMFLILEFSQPFTGVFRISSEGIDTALAGLIPD